MPETDWIPPRRSETELRQLALDIMEGKVFHDRMIEKEDGEMIRSIFLPLSLALIPVEAVQTWGLTYQYFTEAGERGVNGYPVFMSVKIVHREDMPFLSKLTEEIKARREAFLKPATSSPTEPS
jgi:hypothetical protein